MVNDRARRVLIAAALLALAWALLIWLSGGIDARILGVTVRARGVVRPLVVSVVLLSAAGWVSRGSLRDLPAAASILVPWFAGTLAFITVVDALRYGSFVAAGSDAYGYLSQAYGWATGRLPRPYSIALVLPFSSGDWIQTPLGHWLGRAPHTMVPSYAPGLPLLMAAGIRIGGALGPYLVVPLSAGAFVLATYALGRRLAGPVAGGAAALVAATSPIVLFMSLSPMSDVPAGAAWTAAAAFALSTSRTGAVFAGLCAALGVLIRPNLVVLALVPFAWIVTAHRGRERAIRAAAFAAFVSSAAVAIGALNAYWYGSPFLSGYGDPKALYSVQNVRPNLAHYAAWLSQSQSALIFAAAACAFLLPKGRGEAARPALAVPAAMFVVTFLGYVTYSAFDQWWYLRFLMPGLGGLMALGATGIVAVGERVRRPWGSILGLVLLGVIVWRSTAYAAAVDMFGPLRESEHKYMDVGMFVREMPPDSVFFALQHSGSIRYYGGRYTLRYDLLDRDAAAQAPAALERLGLHPYLAIDEAEIEAVRKAFALPAGPLPWPYVASTTRFGGFSILDLSSAPSGLTAGPIESATGPRYAAPLPVTIAPRHVP